MTEFLNSEIGNWICGFATGLGIGAIIVDWVRR